MSHRLNFLLLSGKKEFADRASELAKEFEYSLSVIEKKDLLVSGHELEQVQFFLFDAMSFSTQEAVSATQSLRQFAQDAFLCVVLQDQTPFAEADAIKKAGASLVMQAKDFLTTSKLEFLASQIIRASFVPVKLSEFSLGSVFDFTLYHLLPLNQKLLPILPRGNALTEARIKKLEGVAEVYVRRDEVDRYRLYIEAHPENAELGLRAKCRAQYLSYCHAYSQLMFSLIDFSEQNSIKEAKWLFDRCDIIARELLVTLSAVGEAWDIVNNSSIGEFGSVERSPTVSVYAGLLSLLSSSGEPAETMVAGLLADVGMLELSPQITRKLRQGHSLAALDEAEKNEYQKHPLLSLEQLAHRKIPLSDKTKEIIAATHEKYDGTGFPSQKKAEQIPVGAMLIYFSEIIDQGAMIRLGHPRRSVQEVRQQTLAQESANAKIFSPALLQKLKPVI